ncbi:hypothetical protein RUM43_011873 [Polyplax serrata]|uniref:Uncharacterized protein n=1 Tax=Polyplax serrata TaxID=468196 RepID=A0AAN8P5Z5_POLSC
MIGNRYEYLGTSCISRTPASQGGQRAAKTIGNNFRKTISNCVDEVRDGKLRDLNSLGVPLVPGYCHIHPKTSTCSPTQRLSRGQVDEL